MEIDRHFCDGDRWNGHVGTGEGDGGKSPLLRSTKTLRDIADDLASRTPAVIASADAPAAAGVYTQVDIQAMVDLLNEIKAALNAVSGGALLTTKVG